jgi:hypothetical protein
MEKSRKTDESACNPQELEGFWRDQVYAARQKYDEASANVTAMLRKRDLLELRDALEQQSAARQEWKRVLRVFQNLVLYGQKPFDQ